MLLSAQKGFLGKFITEFDLFITPVFIIISMAVALLYMKRLHAKDLKRVFFFSFVFRIAISLAQALLGSFQVVSRDDYAGLGKKMAEIFYANPFRYVQVLFSSAGEINKGTAPLVGHHMFTNSTTFPVCKIGSLIDIFTYHSYSATVLIIGLIVFITNWALYKKLILVYNKGKHSLLLSIPLLYQPSLIFWSSAYMKDSFTYAAICVLFWCILYKPTKTVHKLVKIMLIVLAAMVILPIKSYILYAVILAYLLSQFFIKTVLALWRKRMRFLSFNTVVLSLIFLVAVIFIIGKVNYAYSLENAIRLMKGYQTWIFVSTQDGGPTYDFGTYEPTVLGVLPIIPQAIGVCVFRPYLWEVKNPVMLLTSLESLLFIFITLFAIFKIGFIKMIRSIFQDDYVFFLFLFSLIFLFLVGFSTFNFGSLARYKIPGQLSIYLVLCIIWKKSLIAKESMQSII